MIAIASSITATAMHRTAALFIVSLISSVMYHADRSEEKRYSQAEGDEVFGSKGGVERKACRCYGKRLPTAGDITRHRASEASRRLFFSLDHLIRLRQHVRRDRQTDLLGGFEIDHKFKLRRLFDRQISRLGTFENPVSIICDALVALGHVRPVRHEPTHIDITFLYKHGW